MFYNEITVMLHNKVHVLTNTHEQYYFSLYYIYAFGGCFIQSDLVHIYILICSCFPWELNP